LKRKNIVPNKMIDRQLTTVHNMGCKPCGGCDDLGAAEPARGLP